MSDVVNKTTLQYKKSVHTPDFPANEWLINPVLPDCEQKYWRIYNGALKEMTVLQKKAVDDAALLQAKEAQKSMLIMDKTRSLAVEALKVDGVLDSNGDII